MLSRDWALSMFVLQFITSTPTLSIARISHVLRPSRVAACPETMYNSAVADMSGCGTVTLNIQLPLSRDRWQKKARKTNEKLHWNVFRFFRQEVKRVIRIAKKENVRSELLKCNGNTNYVWKVIDAFLTKIHH